VLNLVEKLIKEAHVSDEEITKTALEYWPHLFEIFFSCLRILVSGFLLFTVESKSKRHVCGV